MILAVNQNPRTILSSIRSAPTGIMLLKPTRQIVSMSDVEFTCLKALKNINVIYEYNLFKC